MKALAAALMLTTFVSLAPGLAWSQTGTTTDDASTSLESLLQQGLGLFGGLFGNASSVSAPSIAIGSGSSSTTTTTTNGIASLFGSGFPTLDLSSGTGSGGGTSLFDLLFGAMPASTGSGTATSGQSSMQSLTNQALNLAQSFSSSFQNIFSPQTTTGGEGGASNQTNTQNNLTTIQPLTALTGTTSAITLSSNNGFILSVPGLTFNFGQ